MKFKVLIIGIAIGLVCGVLLTTVAFRVCANIVEKEDAHTIALADEITTIPIESDSTTDNQLKAESSVLMEPVVEEVVEVEPEVTEKILVEVEPEVTEKILVERNLADRSGNSRYYKITDTMLQELKSYEMTATAYTLSVASCGKKRDHPLYGITRSGARAQVDRTVAVDPKVIPLGSVLYIEFPDEYSSRNGLYVAEDTGKAIKGNKIDIFFGEDNPGEEIIEKLALQFGRRKVKVYMVERGD